MLLILFLLVLCQLSQLGSMALLMPHGQVMLLSEATATPTNMHRTQH